MVVVVVVVVPVMCLVSPVLLLLLLKPILSTDERSVPCKTERKYLFILPTFGGGCGVYVYDTHKNRQTKKCPTLRSRCGNHDQPDVSNVVHLRTTRKRHHTPHSSSFCLVLEVRMGY